MTFLELVQETINDAGTGTTATVPGGLPGVSSGYAGLCKRLVQEAWLNIQNSEDAWTFMQRSVDIPIVHGVRRYPLEAIAFDTPFGDWRFLDGTRRERTLVSAGNLLQWDFVDRAPGGGRGTARLRYIPYLLFQRQYERGLAVGPQRSPREFSVDPATHAVVVGPEPAREGLEEGSAILFAEYKAASQRLMEDEDEPRGLPEGLHPVIKWAAIVAVQAFDEAQVGMSAANERYQAFMGDMRRTLLPRSVIEDSLTAP